MSIGYFGKYLCLLLIGVGSSSVESRDGYDIPVIFNAPFSARPGDIVGVQGENFGEEPIVTLLSKGGDSPIKLPAVNKVGKGWLSFKVPDSATGALAVQISNGQDLSVPISLNAARAYHLDALQISARGTFRIFGRSLLQPGFTPVVTVDGQPALVDIGASDEHMLTVTAPQVLRTSAQALIVVDNGNGSGSSVLDRQIEVTAGGSDPFALGVGWAGSFASIASRQPSKVACTGVTDDAVAVQSAMDKLAALGGGVLQLPLGTCRFASSLKLKSKVVLQGAGKDRTTIHYESNYPLWGRGLDLAGVRELTLTNVGGRIESPLLQQSTRIFFQSVRFELAGGVQMFLTNNKNFVITDSEFVQPKNPHDNGPYVLSETGGLVFTRNSTIFANGSPTFAGVHDSYIFQNKFTRDARGNMNSKGVIHSLAMDFAHRIAVVENTFDVLGGPIKNKSRNDGETILTEGGGGRRTENVGTVTSATSTTLADSTNKINVFPFGDVAIPENYGVAIVGGKGAGQTRRVAAYAGGTLTVDRAWDLVPDTTSHYATFVWGLEKSLIKGNTLAQNPRGIWLYQTAVRDVEIINNTINEGGGIYLRTAQNLKERLFVPMYGVRIANNTIRNTTREWTSYINVAFVRMDEKDFGFGTIGIEIRNNVIHANNPNLSLTTEESGGEEGYISKMRFEGPSQGLSRNQTRLLGTIIQNNKCSGCAVGIIVREGAKGTVQDGNLITP